MLTIFLKHRNIVVGTIDIDINIKSKKISPQTRSKLFIYKFNSYPPKAKKIILYVFNYSIKLKGGSFVLTCIFMHAI